MILSRTPFRMTMFGGGTDYPEHFSEHGGRTLSASINKYSYVMVSDLQAFFDYQIRLTYSRTELVNDLDELRHPAVRACLQHVGIEKGVEIHYTADLPARSGLGSSSCFVVGLLNALYEFSGGSADAERLANDAVHVERNMIGERVGFQDQFTCATGGLVHIEYSVQSEVNAQRLDMPEEHMDRLADHFMLFYTGVQRRAHDILERQMEKTVSGELEEQLCELGDMVPSAIDILLSDRDIISLGEMLHEGWLIKQRLSDEVSSPYIDSLYQAARDAGATGGKIMGAGGGGFLLLFVLPSRQDAVRSALRNCSEVEFSFETSGSSIVYTG